MKFTKMHGLGNDYIFLYCPEGEPENVQTLAYMLSQPHTGVGSDGLICICPSRQADFRMAMFNADGSRGSMCGNGIRCLGKYVYDRGYTGKRTLTVETEGGLRQLTLQVEGGRVQQVTVDMGIPQVGKLVDLQVGEDRISGIPVWIGNPHLVCQVNDVDKVDVSRLGAELEHHPKLGQRVNVEFVHPKSHTRIAMRVWERGSGETMACGTGACATLAALATAGIIQRTATVELPGGELKVSWKEDNHIDMTGPAVTVFEGEFEHWPMRHDIIK